MAPSSGTTSIAPWNGTLVPRPIRQSGSSPSPLLEVRTPIAIAIWGKIYIKNTYYIYIYMFETTHLETSKETSKRIGHPIKKSLTTANISNNHRVVSNVVSQTDLWKSFPSEICQFQNDIPPKVTEVFPYVFLRNQWIWHLILRPPQKCRTSRTRSTKWCGRLRHTYQMRVFALKKKVGFSGFWWICPFSKTSFRFRKVS